MSTNNKPVRLLVVDDSTLARKAIISSLAPFQQIQIVGQAADAYAARDKILELRPDIITLDIEMPRMDGLTFLKAIMKHRPMPVVIISSLTKAGSEKALEALHLGAVDVMEKPTGSQAPRLDGRRLADKIIAAAGARLRQTRDEAAIQTPAAVARPAPSLDRQVFSPRKLILIGASAGGTEALKAVLASMQPGLPGICIVQHIPPYFSKALADRLNKVCPMEVREAKTGDVVKPGLALIAPGGWHMLVKWQGSQYTVELNEGPQVHFQRPSVDILFKSAVRAGAGPHVAAALLTGMGSDGAEGLLRLREAGAATIAQNEETCVIFGMPREAIRLGAAQRVLPLDKIGEQLSSLISKSPTRPPLAAVEQRSEDREQRTDTRI